MKPISTFVGCLLASLIFAAGAVMFAPSTAMAGEAEAETADSDRYKGDFRQMRVVPGQMKYRYPFTDHRGFFSIGPHIGAPGVFGDVSGINGATDVSVTSADAVENLDLATGIFVEAGYRHVGVSVDFTHFDLSTDEVERNAEGAFDLQKFITNVRVNWTYEPLENLELGPVAGVRHIYLRSATSESWADPLVGLHGRYTLADLFFLSYYADVGGIAFGSDISFQAYGALGITTNKVDFELGYRHLYVDFESDDLEYDMSTTGPVFSTIFRF